MKTLPVYESGYLSVPLDYTGEIAGNVNLYYKKFLPNNHSQAKGDVIFLSGGPNPHYAGFDQDLGSPITLYKPFEDYNLIMFDYRGFNCSDKIQVFDDFKNIEMFYDIKTFARDVITLKRFLVGQGKATLVGASFGYLLGVQVLNDYSEEFNGAILGLGNTNMKSSYLGIVKFDQEILPKMFQIHTDFNNDLEKLREIILNQELKININNTGNTHNLTWNEFTTIVSQEYRQSTRMRETLPALVKGLVNSKKEAFDTISKLHQKIETMKWIHLNDLIRPAPTPMSIVSNYYRCNIFFPKVIRENVQNTDFNYNYFSPHHILDYWNEACEKLDQLKSKFYDISDTLQNIDLPILTYYGANDEFDQQDAILNMKKLTNELDVMVFDDWAHDYGPVWQKGVSILNKSFSAFLRKM